MEKLELLRSALWVAVVVTTYVTAVLLLALFDGVLTLLLFRVAAKVKQLHQVPQPEAESNLPKLPEGAGTVYVLGGDLKRW